MNAVLNINYNQVLELAMQLPSKYKIKLGKALSQSVAEDHANTPSKYEIEASMQEVCAQMKGAKMGKIEGRSLESFLDEL